MQRRISPSPAGFTLVEVLVATVITVIVVGSVATLFAWVTDNVTDSRAAAEISDRLRHTKQLLQADLMGITAPTNPPLDPAKNLGYFEAIEGPLGNHMGYIVSSTAASGVSTMNSFAWGAANVASPATVSTTTTVSTTNVAADTTMGDPDDILMFTTRRSTSEPFRGRWASYSVSTSTMAEVAWFLRGNELHRICLLVIPGIDPSGFGAYAGNPTASDPYDRDPNGYGFYRDYDISLRQQGGWASRHLDEITKTNIAFPNNTVAMVRSNSLGDLTKRENRYAHQPLAFPHDARFWNTEGGYNFGLPTYKEMTDAEWPFPYYEPPEEAQKGADSAIHTEFWPADTSAEGPSLYRFNFRQAAQFYISPDQRSGTAQTNSLTPQALRYSATVINNKFNSQLAAASMTKDFYSVTASGMSSGSGRYSGRAPEDIVMTNVLSFDVKVWDPGAPIFAGVSTDSSGNATTPMAITPSDPGYFSFKNGTITQSGAMIRFFNSPVAANAPIAFGAYVDLNYMRELPSTNTQSGVVRYGDKLLSYESAAGLPANSLPRPKFGDDGNTASGIKKDANLSAIYDTWSTHYETDGIDNDGDGLIDEGRNGYDDDGKNGIDDPGELEAPPPYADALRGIQIRIRAFDPTTRQIRETTIQHEFLEE